MTICHMLRIVFLSQSRIRVSAWTDTTLDHDWETEDNCVSIVSLPATDVNFNIPPLTWNEIYDARLVSQTRKHRSTKKLTKHVWQLILVETIQSAQAWSSTSRPIQGVEEITSVSSYNHNLVLTMLLFLSSRVHGLHWEFSRSVASVSVHKIRVAYYHCFASCHCCHDGFTQLYASFSMFTINADNCLFICSCLQVCSPVTSSIIDSSPSFWNEVYDPYLQRCCGTEAEIALRQHLRISSLSTSSWHWGLQIPRVMCFVRCRAPNRSMKQFAVELSLCISIFIEIPRSWFIDFKPPLPSCSSEDTKTVILSSQFCLRNLSVAL